MTDAAPDLEKLLLLRVPIGAVRKALERAAGKELESGKFANPESSSALAVNGFGRFLDRPELLPQLPGLQNLDWPALGVEIEKEVRFPWAGGRHPWLDAFIETERHIIGVESKRFEPFRDRKQAKLSDAYLRDVWGLGMEPWCAMRDLLMAEPTRYKHLDAAQLVKHAFGLATEAGRRSKQPVLFYIFAEPMSGRQITSEQFVLHRSEFEEFQKLVCGGRVKIAGCAWRDWLETFSGDLKEHAEEIIARFAP